MTKNIVLCFPLESPHVEQIQKAAGDAFGVIVSGQESIADDIFKADVFCGHAKVPVDWDAVVTAGRLKWIQSSAAGLDHCLVPAVIESDIVVSGCSGLFANQVAEQTTALLFSLLRRIPLFLNAQKQRNFERQPTDEIQGKTVGIVGFGGNGQRIARVLHPFGARIIATDLFPGSPSDMDFVQCLPANGLDDLFKQSDIVIVTLPLTAENEQLIRATQFQCMRPGSYFINVGRGSVVDQESLVAALQDGRLAGAGLDVVDPEPLPHESPLWSLSNTIITPHVGAQSQTRIPKTVNLFCDNLLLWLGNRDLRNLVDKKLGFPRPENRHVFS